MVGMKSFNIAFFETQPWEKRFIKAKLSKNPNISDMVFFKEKLLPSNAGIARNFHIISTFIYSQLSKPVLQALKKLRFIATRSTGFDHIDLKTCKALNIKVSNVPYYGENTVAEHTFALILALSRNVHKSYVRQLRGDYNIQGLKGFDLKGKTIGVIGAGHIGLHVVRIAKGFGMNVLVFDIHKNQFLSEVLGFKYVSLQELLKHSDIITLHVPYNKATHHLINKQNIKLVKKGALLINTSRGAVVDTEALIYALENNILRGVGLDVIEGEELIKEEKQLLYHKLHYEKLKELARDHLLLAKENVVYTPHIAFYSQEALERIIETTINNITAFIKGKPQNLVF